MGDLSRSFSKREFDCQCGTCKDEFYVVDPKLIKILQAIRDQAGALRVSSGHRCATHNAAVGGAKKSWHLLRGCKLHAADVQLLDPTRRNLDTATRLYIAADQADSHGLGLYVNRCHIDTRPEAVFKSASRARWLDKDVKWRW